MQIQRGPPTKPGSEIHISVSLYPYLRSIYKSHPSIRRAPLNLMQKVVTYTPEIMGMLWVFQVDFDNQTIHTVHATGISRHLSVKRTGAASVKQHAAESF